jgi:DNA-directed RNA polymerase II subunit RPB2
METMTHVLHYPQKPICQNDCMDDMHYNDLPGEFNAVVAISTYYGGNQEDAIIASQRAIDLGMGRSTYYRGYKEIESKTVGAEEYFGRPDEPDAQRLDADGIIPVGVSVKEGDMIIGKLSNSIGTDGAPMKPRCTFIKHGEHGIVDAVVITTNPGGTRTAKVRIRQERVPEVGDKFAAKHSQKGVGGRHFSPVDLPFTASGIIPDFIINPSSQPSRMTLGHMKEIRSGKYGALSGTFPNSSMFGDKNGDMEDIANGLAEMGYQRMGWERMINGTTGEFMDALLYIGVCSYQRLKHMVQDKIHARGSKGPIASLTRQPSEGNQIPYTHVIITVMVCVIIQ